MKTEALMTQFNTNDPGGILGVAEAAWRVFDPRLMMLEDRPSPDRAIVRGHQSDFCLAFKGSRRDSSNVSRAREIEQQPASIIADRYAERPNLQAAPSRLRLSDVEPIEWANARTVLAGWASLSDDWDDNGAAPLPEIILNAVERFIQAAEKMRVAEPKPYISSDGEVGFHWEGKLRAAVSFLSEDRFLAYVGRAEGAPVRIAGPLELAAASTSMFKALAAIS